MSDGRQLHFGETLQQIWRIDYSKVAPFNEKFGWCISFTNSVDSKV